MRKSGRAWTKRGALLGATLTFLTVVLPAPVGALNGALQLLTGGTSGSGAGTRYTAPGLANTYNLDFPDTGLGREAAELRMVAGTLGKFRVSVVTQGTATSGGVTLTVIVNGVDTVLTCSVGKDGGDCGSGSKTVVLQGGDRLAVRVDSTLDAGFYTYTFTMTYG